ncbi:unnamed protein product [Ectocarpus sp. 4 AP-2014]
MAALAAKPAKLSTGAAGLTGPAGPPGRMPPIDPNPTVSSHSGPNLSAYAYANGVALGKELGGMFKEVPSVASIQRLMESMKLYAKQQWRWRSGRYETSQRAGCSRELSPGPPLPCRRETPGTRVGDGVAGGERGRPEGDGQGETVALEAAAREAVAVEWRPAKRWQGRRDRPRARRGGRKLCWFRYGYAERYQGGSPSVPPSGRTGDHWRRAYRLPGDTREPGTHFRGLGVAVSFPGQRRRFSSRGGAGFATVPEDRPSCSVGASATTAP